MSATRWMSHSSHWGAFAARVDGDRVVVRPDSGDLEPSPLLDNLTGTTLRRARIERPLVRTGWLAHGSASSAGRGVDGFVAVDWDQALDLVAGELDRIRGDSGMKAVFGGSYGWGSAGRFHHAQSQVHRFLNTLGGFVRSVGTYSLGASPIVLKHVLGDERILDTPTTWPVLADHTELFVCFGGMPPKNARVNAGGASRHRVAHWLRQARARGARFRMLSPIRDDLAAELDATWHPIRPGTDVAVMLALAYVIIRDGRHDKHFLDDHCVGFERVRSYLFGASDGVVKSPFWAEAISGVPAREIEALADEMVSHRTLVSVSWSLQRAPFGEQPVWAAITLAAVLGQLGLPGGGFGHGYGAVTNVGAGRLPHPVPTLPQGHNSVDEYIPVARIADMLLFPGQPFEFNGSTLTYPDIDLVYWCGGNPFHHHQDLTRLRLAFQRARTVIVHEAFQTATARHADIVLPVTTTLERDDLGAARNDDLLVAMRRVMEPVGQARDDYNIFSQLAGRLGVADIFTEGRDADQWLRHLYEDWRAAHAPQAPPFSEFWVRGQLVLRERTPRHVYLADFRADPVNTPLQTPTGKIELWSETVSELGYDDCPGLAVWRAPPGWHGAETAAHYPLTLVANNPATRLHSQLDHGATSRATKVAGREPVRINPQDATTRGLVDGSVARLYNDRGSCLAGVVLSDAVMPGVIQLSTGAWLDPEVNSDGTLHCNHGNPNVLTPDMGTSRLAQGCAGQHALVEVELFAGEPHDVLVFEPWEVADGITS